MNAFELSRNWFEFCFNNPEKIKPIHSAIYFFAIEHCNRLGWKIKFGFPSQMVMEAIGVKNWRTYSKALHEIVEFGFIEMIEISKNQYSSNIIAIVKNTKADTKALDKALSKHSTKQGQSTVSIIKQETSNKEQLTEETLKKSTKQIVNNFKKWDNEKFTEEIKEHGEEYSAEMKNSFYAYWTEPDSKGKMKFQLNKTWCTSRRLANWNNRSNNGK